jgi:predicted metal-binding transcription factor (methanogenesis marker protein 9)
MALESQTDVEQLADALTQTADASHAWLLQAIGNRTITPDEARAAFHQETLLRQQANSLYVDAATCIVQGLALPQKEFMGIIRDANKRVARIKKIAVFMDLLADLLALASACCAAKPKPILAALKEIKQDVENLRQKTPVRSKSA